VLGNRDIASGCDCSRRRRCGGRRRVRRGRESGDAPAQRRGRPPPMVATPAAPISSPPRPAALPTSPSTRSAASSLPRGQEPLGLPPSAQLPRRHRGGDLLLQARIWRRSLHLARTGPLQGLHLAPSWRTIWCCSPGSNRLSRARLQADEKQANQVALNCSFTDSRPGCRHQCAKCARRPSRSYRLARATPLQKRAFMDAH